MAPNFKLQVLNSEKGISLLVSIFILAVMTAIVLGITSILINRMLLIQDIGFSVTAFYAADSGVEKILYFDRKKVVTVNNQNNTTTIVRGLCALCENCPGAGLGMPNDQTPIENCNDCKKNVAAPSPEIPPLDGCDIDKCTSCRITFTNPYFDNRYFSVVADVPGRRGSDDFTSGSNDFIFYSAGFYHNVTRAIQLEHSLIK